MVQTLPSDSQRSPGIFPMQDGLLVARESSPTLVPSEPQPIPKSSAQSTPQRSSFIPSSRKRRTQSSPGAFYRTNSDFGNVGDCIPNSVATQTFTFAPL